MVVTTLLYTTVLHTVCCEGYPHSHTVTARETCEGDDMGEEGGKSTKVYKEIFDHDSEPTHEGEGEEVLGITFDNMIMICINNIHYPLHI